MARVIVTLHGEVAEKAETNRLYLEGETVKDIFEKLKEQLPFIEKELKYNRIICLVNGRNIETLKKENTKLEDFDMLGITLKGGGFIDFFPPDGGG